MTTRYAVVASIIVLFGCSSQPSTTKPAECDPSLRLPSGFCAHVFATDLGPVRDIAVRANGEVIAAVLDQRHQPGGVLILRDTSRSGTALAEVANRFGNESVHGIALVTDSLFLASTATSILRFRLSEAKKPRRIIDTLVTGLAPRDPPSHTLAVNERDVFVNIGAASNACAGNQPGARGREPCPELESSGGIWSFRLTATNAHFKDGTLVATGLHNAVALAIDPADGVLYAASHDRDGLREAWPALYSPDDAATRPAEELVRVASNRADYGWPYCYYDLTLHRRVLAPEYGGDKQQAGRCDRVIQPLFAFPAHWSPMSMLFYTGKMFPAKYRSGMFIAFHGSANRSPLPQEGYQIVFVPLQNGFVTGYDVFADGFSGAVLSADSAAHRPVGLAQGPDGSLYVSDDKGGTIWRITYDQQQKATRKSDTQQRP